MKSPSNLPDTLASVGVGRLLCKVFNAYARVSRRPVGVLTFLVLPLLSPEPIAHDFDPTFE